MKKLILTLSAMFLTTAAWAYGSNPPYYECQKQWKICVTVANYDSNKTPFVSDISFDGKVISTLNFDDSSKPKVTVNAASGTVLVQQSSGVLVLGTLTEPVTSDDLDRAFFRELKLSPGIAYQIATSAPYETSNCGTNAWGPVKWVYENVKNTLSIKLNGKETAQIDSVEIIGNHQGGSCSP